MDRAQIIVRFRHMVLCLATLALALGCTAKNSLWGQIHGNMQNTAFQPIGPSTLDISKAQQFNVGDPLTTSPVETPSGTILVSVEVKPLNNIGFPSWRIVEIHPNPTGRKPQYITVFTSEPFGSPLSTPAVDSHGNVYFLSYQYASPPAPDASTVALNIWKLDSTGTKMWANILNAMTSRSYVAPAPKLIEYAGNASVFVGVQDQSGNEIMAVDGNGNIRTVPSCVPSVTNPGIAAQPTPAYTPPPPYSEDPTLAMALDGRGTPFLIDASDNCGVNFYLLDESVAVPGWPPGLLYPQQFAAAQANSNLGTPAVSIFSGYAILSQDGSLQAYDFTAGKKIQNWSISDIQPEPMALALNSAAITDFSNGYLYLVATDHPVTNIAPNYQLGQVYATAITLSRIYVLGKDGVYAFDTNFNLLSFAAIPHGPSENGGSLAVTSNGSLVVASRNGTTYIFPPN